MKAIAVEGIVASCEPNCTINHGLRRKAGRAAQQHLDGSHQAEPTPVGEPEGAPTAAQMQAFQANQDALSSALSRLLVVVERYPELKAVQAFQDLQVQLEGTENRIAVERRRFNEVTRDYNTARRRFPAVLIAGFLGFDDKPYFESKPGAEEPPQVEF